MTPHPDHAWDPWHPSELARRIGSVPAVWYVVGGWALDLWHGQETRAHEDLEFAVLRRDVALFRAALPDLAFCTAHAGVVTHLKDDVPPPEEVSQLWGHDRHGPCWRVDMMIEPGTPATWIFKRDAAIRLPRHDVLRSAAGIPYLAPEAVLLFKARHLRAKDRADFRCALPSLGSAARARLAGWLDAAHPGHPWRSRL